MSHPLTKVRLLKAMPPHKAKEIVYLRGKKAEYILKMGIGEVVQEEVKEVKEEKVQIETKEEKFVPETKEEKVFPIRELTEAVKTMNDDELLDIIKKDERISARRLAEAEIRRRDE